MSEELKPCPFCGGEALFETYGGTACAVVCQTCGCGTPTMRLDDGMIAADLWNRRDERTCRQIVDGETASCSECGERMTSFSLHCPSCGARVVVDNADR